MLDIESNLIFNAKVGVMSHFVNVENEAQGVAVTHPG